MSVSSQAVVMATDRGVVEDWLSEFKVSHVTSSVMMCVFPDQSSAVPLLYPDA